MCVWRNRSVSPFVVLALAVAAAVTGLAGCSGGDEDMDSAFKRALEESVAEAGDIDRRYSDEDIEELVDEFILNLNVDARYPTPAARRAAEEEFDRWLSLEATQVDRLQHLFEVSVEMRMLGSYSTLPAEVGEGGELEQAFEAALNECAAAAGWPDIDLQNKSMSHAERLESERGIPLDTHLELAHECSQVAETYPTLTPERRDELLEMRRDHYLGVAREIFDERR